MSIIQISDKLAISVYPDYVAINRSTVKGKRYVNVPRLVTGYAVDKKELIRLCPLEEGLCPPPVVIDTPLSDWKIQKSSFREVTYIAFAKYENGIRVG